MDNYKQASVREMVKKINDQTTLNLHAQKDYKVITSPKDQQCPPNEHSTAHESPTLLKPATPAERNTTTPLEFLPETSTEASHEVPYEPLEPINPGITSPPDSPTISLDFSTEAKCEEPAIPVPLEPLIPAIPSISSPPYSPIYIDSPTPDEASISPASPLDHPKPPLPANPDLSITSVSTAITSVAIDSAAAGVASDTIVVQSKDMGAVDAGPLKQSTSLRRKIIMIGNPGAGKSTILSSLVQGPIFQSGVAVGKGKTKEIQEFEYNGTLYVDTPGLADIKLREIAAIEIAKALKQGGNYKVIRYSRHNYII